MRYGWLSLEPQGRARVKRVIDTLIIVIGVSTALMTFDSVKRSTRRAGTIHAGKRDKKME
jgi:hypothetical protein